VNVFDTGTHDGVAYIVMELFEGTTLRDVLAQDGPLEFDAVVRIGLQVLEALQFAHENGLVHRDVKPANILVAPDGRVKVTDFGIAKAAFESSAPTTTGAALGSAPYMSPEQVEGKPVDGRSDVYACGATLYEALTGRQPFEGETPLAAAMVRLTRDPIPPRAVRAGIPRTLDAIVMRSLSRDPDRRFASAGDMAASLSRLGVVLEPIRPRAAAAPVPGKRATVTGFRLVTPAPGFHFQVLVGNSPTDLEGGPGRTFTAKRSMRQSIPEQTGRYVVLWMKDAVSAPGGYRDVVAEFRIFGTRG
jgi:serine/threonine-protein kinase